MSSPLKGNGRVLQKLRLEITPIPDSREILFVTVHSDAEIEETRPVAPKISLARTAPLLSQSQQPPRRMFANDRFGSD
jgi:hypothetical protein